MKREMNENWETIGDIVKVNAGWTIALISSFQTDLEWWIRISGMILAAFYTVIKIYEHYVPKGK